MKRGIEPFICFTSEELKAAEERYKTISEMIERRALIVTAKKLPKSMSQMFSEEQNLLKHYLNWEGQVIKILKERGVK